MMRIVGEFNKIKKRKALCLPLFYFGVESAAAFRCVIELHLLPD
jgi:hypothetical protein